LTLNILTLNIIISRLYCNLHYRDNCGYYDLGIWYCNDRLIIWGNGVSTRTQSQKK